MNSRFQSELTFNSTKNITNYMLLYFTFAVINISPILKIFSFCFCFCFQFAHNLRAVNRSQASSYNCEMSDLDQNELKLNLHFARTTDRDFWLFGWVYDVTCRDKVATVGGGGNGSNRVNNDRRMDIFREKDGKRIIYALCT